jgi:hypothetical protein
MNTPAVTDELTPLREFTEACAALVERLDGVPLRDDQIEKVEGLVELQADLTTFHWLEAAEREALLAPYAQPRARRYPTTGRLG